jgi:hypothetical protein
MACYRDSFTYLTFHIYDKNPSAALGPEDYSASNRIEYQKQKNNNVFGE